MRFLITNDDGFEKEFETQNEASREASAVATSTGKPVQVWRMIGEVVPKMTVEWKETL